MILLFSGTTEGRRLTQWLSANGLKADVKVATEYGASAMDGVAGSCGGVEGIATMIQNNEYDLVVDSTHPYASTISSHIKEACMKTGTKLIRISRSSSFSDTAFKSIDEAVEYLSKKEGNVLVTTGTKDVSKYKKMKGWEDRVIVRALSIPSSVSKCAEEGFEGKRLICGQGPFSEEINYATLIDYNIKYMVTKDSGPEGGFEEKLRAAKRAGAELVVIGRPEDNGISYNEAISEISKLYNIHKKRKTVHLIGVGVGKDGITLRAHRKIMESDTIIGATRMLSYVDTSGKSVYDEYKHDKISNYLKTNDFDVASILLSGDTGFYSGAKKILEAISDEYDIDIECGTSSPSYLCSKLGIPWQDVVMVSAHGKESNYACICNKHSKTFFLLNGKEGVNRLLNELIDYNMNYVDVTIGINLGEESETILSGKPSELMDKEYGKLCVALICNPSYDGRISPGIDDDAFERFGAPMTKYEARTLTIKKLALHKDSIIYDIGAGTGSVSVEAALNSIFGKVYAIEKKKEAILSIEANRKKFKASNIEIVEGIAPDCFANLPAPTHAFIGGSSGNLKEIIVKILAKNPKVRIVINSISLETLSEAVFISKELGLKEETVQLSATRVKKIANYNMMESLNPVFITTAVRE